MASEILFVMEYTQTAEHQGTAESNGRCYDKNYIWMEHQIHQEDSVWGQQIGLVCDNFHEGSYWHHMYHVAVLATAADTTRRTRVPPLDENWFLFEVDDQNQLQTEQDMVHNTPRIHSLATPHFLQKYSTEVAHDDQTDSQ